MDRVLRSWLGSAIEPHAQADLDRNYLLHAMVYSGLVDTDETRALFDAIGSHAMRVPWSYTGDPESSFLYWRDQAFHARPHAADGLVRIPLVPAPRLRETRSMPEISAPGRLRYLLPGRGQP